DGIRDDLVTGVQTCALPILSSNQCTCDLLLDFILTNALVLGFSIRVTDNRFKEPVGIQNVFSPVFLSATTFAVMNETVLNQGTRSEERRVGKECVCRQTGAE